MRCTCSTRRPTTARRRLPATSGGWRVSSGRLRAGCRRQGGREGARVAGLLARLGSRQPLALQATCFSLPAACVFKLPS